MVYKVYKEESIWGTDYVSYCGTERLGATPDLDSAKALIAAHKNRELVYEERG